MTISEFSDQFDVLYNNITSNQAPGLNEYEKSLFLTKAEKEIVKNYFTANSKGNSIGQGFDDSAKRQADFSVLMQVANCNENENCLIWHNSVSETTRNISLTDIELINAAYGNEVSWTELPWNETWEMRDVGEIFGEDRIGFLYNNNEYYISSDNVGVNIGDSITNRYDNTIKIDSRSTTFSYPNDVFIVINESIKTGNTIKQVIPLRYDEYTRLMSKPFKRPLKNQVWRLINKGDVNISGKATKTVEIIAGPGDNITSYSVRYVRVPTPIIVANLDGLSIDGQSTVSEKCEIDPILHEDILQRAVELAKVAWTATGQDNTNAVLQVGQRSE